MAMETQATDLYDGTKTLERQAGLLFSVSRAIEDALETGVRTCARE
ncbi:MAG: hypothetical protein HYR85_09930 [Planctomycetes bacterium]|nr:hypothetical protein [Planctomycetota bacterium]